MKKITSLLLANAMMIMSFSTTVLAEESDLGVLTYEEIITPEYEGVRGFNEGFAAVKKDGKWGYIDTENDVVVALKETLSYMYSWSDREVESDFYNYGTVDTEGNFTQIVNDDGVAILSADYILDGRGDSFFFNGYTLGISTVEIVDGVLFDNMNTVMISTDGSGQILVITL